MINCSIKATKTFLEMWHNNGSTEEKNELIYGKWVKYDIFHSRFKKWGSRGQGEREYMTANDGAARRRKVLNNN